jgi:hypothetical protein
MAALLAHKDAPLREAELRRPVWRSEQSRAAAYH